MGPSSLVLAPVRAVRLAARALDDLNTLAERSRRDPDPVEEVRLRLDALIAGLSALVNQVGELIRQARALNATGHSVDAGAEEVVRGASALLLATERLELVGEQIVTGGRDLVDTGAGVERRGAEIVTGGEDLTAVAASLDETLDVFRAALPRLLQGLETAEQLEEAVETVADTIEPLQGTAKRVGRVTRRLGSNRG